MKRNLLMTGVLRKQSKVKKLEWDLRNKLFIPEARKKMEIELTNLKDSLR